MTSLTWDRHKGHTWSYDVVDLGYNYRIDEIRSALGRVQLEKLPRNNQLRQEWTVLYHEVLRELCPSITIPFQNHSGVSSCHLLPILLSEGMRRENFMEQMKSRGNQTSIPDPPIHHFIAYHGLASPVQSSLSVTETVGVREVTLPLYPSLTRSEAMLVVDAVYNSLTSVNQTLST